jgi:hypothetical protein
MYQPFHIATLFLNWLYYLLAFIHFLLLEMGKIYKIYFYVMFPIANLENIRQPISIKEIFIKEMI